MPRREASLRWALPLVAAALVGGGFFLASEQTERAEAAANAVEDRWLFLGKHLGDQQLPEVKELLWRAQALGFNGVVFNNNVMQTLVYRGSDLLRNVSEISEFAKKLGLRTYVTVANFGYAEAFFRLDANLAEGLPVRDALFEVRDGIAYPVTELEDPLPNGGFETFDGDELADFGLQDLPGEVTFADTSVKRSGKASLRIEEPSRNPRAGNARINRRIQVRPRRLYRVSAWVKTEGFTAARQTKAVAIGPDGRVLNWNRFGVQANQNWTRHQMIFNSLHYDAVDLYFGAWSGGRGKLWADDLKIEEVGFINLLRRESCPLVVRGERGAVYKEGRDYKELFDPQGPGRNGDRGPAAFTPYHEPPRLEIPGGSRIVEGERLRISYCHTLMIYNHQKVACLMEPGVYKVVEDQVRTVEKYVKPDGYLLGHDEIRIANQCPACREEGRDASELLAENFQRCLRIVRERRPDADVIVWNDMFDPHHNAKYPYFLVHGDLRGGWEAVPDDVSILNWAGDNKLADSAGFFEDRGHRQIISMNMDLSGLDPAERLASVAQRKNIRGVMYTTWTGKFGRMEEFASKLWNAQVPPPASAQAPIIGGGAIRRSRR